MSDKIKSKRTYLVNDETDEKGILIIAEDFDPQGNLLLEIQYDDQGVQVQKVENVFDDKNRLSLAKQYTINEQPDQTIQYEYNESGKVTKMAYQYLDGSVTYKKYSRDEAENIMTIELIDDEGVFEGREVRKFDHEDRLIEETIYDENNEVREKREFEIDEHGQVAETYHLDTEGYETIRFFDYFKDDKARIVKVDTLNQDEIVIRTDKFEYDERGNQSKHIIEDKERGFFITDVWEHDLNNRIIKHERFRGDSLAEETKTRYRDDNLIKEQEVRSGGGVYLNYYEYEFH